MSKATIAYFEGRARVEPIRVILEELAIPYEFQKVTFETWVRMKGETPFGALPSYRKGDMEIFQSHAIIRHLARVHDLYGSTEAERIRCDVIEEALSDLNELVGKAPWRTNFAEERADVLGNETGNIKGVLDAGLERLSAEIVAVVEGDGSTLLHFEHGAAVFGHGAHGLGDVPFGIGLAESHDGAVIHPVGHVAVEGIVSGSLVGQNIGDDVVAKQVGKHIGAIPFEGD